MHKQKTGIIIASAAGMVGTFLPWINIPVLGGIRGTDWDGWITFIMFGLALVVAAVGSKERALNVVQLVLAVILGGGAGLFGVWKIIDFKSSIGEVASDNALGEAMGSIISVGSGLYLIVLAGIAVIFFAFALKKSD
jgi:hypothetical protein